MQEPKENKGQDTAAKNTPPTRPAQVKVRVKPGRAVEEIGGPGVEAMIDRKEAERLVRIGYVEILKEA